MVEYDIEEEGSSDGDEFAEDFFFFYLKVDAGQTEKGREEEEGGTDVTHAEA